MEAKSRIAIVSLGSCGGCDEAILDLNQALIDITSEADMVFWPLVFDHRYSLLENLRPGEITLSLVTGNVHSPEQAALARQVREKSHLILALGACACFGGTPGLANLAAKPTDADWVQSLNQVIDVDYYLPGCPPPSQLVVEALNAVVKHKLPHKGATLAPHRALCDACKRSQSKPEKLALKRIKRIHNVEADPDDCFLAQGVLCFGPVTRGGCGEACLNINMPCRGCFGPVEGISDGGTKFISAVASLLEAETEEQVAERVNTMTDLVGYFYRFSLPLLKLRRGQNR